MRRAVPLVAGVVKGRAMIWDTAGFTRQVLDGLLDPCLVLEPVVADGVVVDFTIAYVNQSAARAAGVPRDDLLQASIAGTILQAQDAGVLDRLVDVYDAETALNGTLVRDVRLDPSRIFDLKATRIEALLLISLREVTEERAAIERLRLLVENLGRHDEVGRQVRQIIDDRAFSSVFQPIVDLASSEVVGYEALTRFADGRAPELVFAEARAVGLGPPLEVAVARAALEAAGALPPDHWLSINFSPPTLIDGFVRDVVASTPRRIVLEVTEHLPIESYGSVRQAMEDLEEVLLAVDDVGSGYAGFGHLLELSPDIVKLDLTLIRNIDQDPARQALTAGLRYFTNQTQTKILAEGIESEAEATCLRELGFDYGQGFLFGHPVPSSALEV